MKKLTASIFASLLTVVTVGAANANIASQGYVDEKVTTLNQSIGAKADQSALDTLTGRVDTAEGEIDTLQTDMAGKANTADLGDLATLDAVGSAQITDGSITSTDISATAAIKKTQLETGVQTSLGKADTALQKSGPLTQGHLLTTDASGNIVDAGAKGALATKDTVSATEIDADAVTTEKILDANVTKAKLASDIQTSLGKADSALQQADLADYAKTAEVASTYETKENAASTYETKANASATYETKTNAAATYATKEEIADLATDENLALKQDKTDNNLATTNKTVVGAINEVRTTANAAIPKVNAEGSNGKYVLTATAVDGTATYKWELIERAADETEGN